MLSLNDIINIGFRKSGFSGYRAEDVDAFVDRVRESYDELLKKNVSLQEEVDKLKGENQENLEKLKVLAGKVEEYRSQEDEIKNALISAQKLSDASVREARHKAEIIVKDANQKADRIVAGADEKVEDQKRELERLRRAVSDFRSSLLEIYKKHLTLINALPQQKPAQQAAAPQPAPAAEAEDDAPKSEKEEPAFTASISNFEDEPNQ
ncbi:MAG TPA: cell division protein DivIVA [Ruminococcaceae bacterium]|jgi:cell division initiation protein|nr:cell division protein DivIVA [Oscillospiraceae bacterium]HBG55820.1 cell division protein DivIVA [Oscillospiraceae bacterium]HBQ45604.1 cell division protein DivIVA [Oscillospiraceae bacterium]HBT90534.1 cell division protein DivIVA [Oscillospiraceae bacterium]HCB91645.1 cell division protein DivIVA [Oscillospiraceae bacterium]